MQTPIKGSIAELAAKNALNRAADPFELTPIAAIPPLSQSRQALMACPALYQSREIEHRPEPDNPDALRGQELHALLAAYIQRLIATKQQTDYTFLDHLIELGSSP